MQEHIKISNIPPRVQYVGDGGQTEFFFPFAIFRPEQVEVFLDGERHTGAMTVLGAGESAGGSVILGEAPGEGVLVTLRRRVAVERTTDFQPAGDTVRATHVARP
ncbi:MAG TPA: phage tail fiber protein, partial [Rhodospirillales bacterium]|nr:phage tail fiber protein [Rhodospirillales bacterium]